METKAIFFDAFEALPLNIRSFNADPRKLLDEFSPITHFIASTILDFPDPLGPIIPLRPLFIVIVVSSENDLNPDILSLLINTVLS